MRITGELLDIVVVGRKEEGILLTDKQHNMVTFIWPELSMIRILTRHPYE